MVEEVCTREELEKLQDFLKAERFKKGLLLYHGDADGICSAALLLKFFKGFVYSPRKGPYVGEDFVKIVMDKKPDLLVFLDLPVDQEWKKLRGFLREIPGLRIVIIDHHIYEKDLNSERVLHINPRFRKKGVYLPAACMVYRILEGFGKEVRPLIWVAALGVIGDYGWEGCEDLLEECREIYPNLLKGEPPKSKLGEGADIIASVVTLKGLSGVAECLKVLMSSEGFEGFESNKRLQDWKREMDDEFQIVVDDFKRKKEYFEKEKLIVYEIKSGLNLTSMLATYFGDKYPDKTVVIKKASGDEWKVSLRSQDNRINLSKILKKCVKGIGSGGGHERAAAALVKDWDKFLKRLKKELRKSSA
jgi:single-stranded DNA-specific DHH superfamily exonuclease